jgi:hypothetical protein
MNPQQRSILNSKPIHRMRWFASLLNWHGLQLGAHVVSSPEKANWTVPVSGMIVWYMTPDLKFNLQINEYPIGQSIDYQATIKADRYGIVHIGWHPFTLFENDDDLRKEVERVRPWLDRNLHKNRAWLRDFKAQHPERLLWPRKKRRGRPPLELR